MIFKKTILVALLVILVSNNSLFCHNYYDKYKVLSRYDNVLLDSIHVIPSYDLIRPKIGVAFSGGGARGFAQIGALKALVEAGIPIDYAVGTSIGSVVAGLYAVGYTPKDLDSIVKHTNWNETITFNDEQSRSDLFLDQKLIQDRSLLTLRFKRFEFVVPEAISLGTRFTSFLQKLIWNGLYHGNGDFNSLKIPFRAVSTDLIKGKTVTLKSGNLVTAIRASSSFPLRYTPVRIDSMLLVDGGLLSNIPTKTLDEFNPDITIAINTISPLFDSELLNKPWNIADQVVSLLMKQFSDNEANLADFNINPELGNHGYTEFNDLDSLVNRAYLATKSRIPEIKQRYNSLLDSIIRNKIILLSEQSDNGEFTNSENIDLEVLDSIDWNQQSIEEITLKIREFVQSEKYQFITISTNKPTKNDSKVSHSSEEQDKSKIYICGYDFPKVSKINIVSGTNHYGLYDTLISTLEIKYSDKPLNNNILEEISESILLELRRFGLSFADISDIKFDYETNELEYHLIEGLINKIEIYGLDGDNDYLVRRELKFSEGDYLNIDNILESWENILSIDFIGEAEIKLIRDDKTDGTNIRIHTKNIGEQSIRIGGRVDNERYTRIGLDFIQDNTFNRGMRASVRLAGGLRDRYLGLKAENSRIFNTLLTSSSSIYYDYTERYVYSKKTGANRNRFEYISNNEMFEERLGAKFLIGAQMEKKGTLSSELRLEEQRYWLKDKNVPVFKNLLSFKVSSIFDDEDKSDYPISGSLLDMSLETTLLNDGKSLSFSKVKFFYRANNSYDIVTIRPSIFFGFADGTTPVTEFFSFGGQEIFMGTREDEQRGRQISVGSLEFRLKSPYPLIFDTYLSIRYDLGSAWENFETIKFSGLRHGVGSTISFDTPLGPANFSLGRSFYFLKAPNAVAWGELMGYFSIGMKF